MPSKEQLTDSLARLSHGVERSLETFIFWSRWLLAPFYVGLALSLLLLLFKFLQEFAHLLETTFRFGKAVRAGTAQVTEQSVILGVLDLVDLTLTGSLLVIVILSGYENFVSKFDNVDDRDRPDWMGTIDFTALKLKLLSSIVAISAVQVLRLFMNLRDPATTDRVLWWSVGIHMMFVLSSVMLALSDRIAYGGSEGGPHTMTPIDAGAEGNAAAKGGGVGDKAGKGGRKG